MSDPPRLGDLRTTPSGLRSLLAGARGDVLDSAAAARIAAGVQASIGGGPGPAAPSGGASQGLGPDGGAGGPSAAAPGGAAAKGAMALVAAAIVAGGIWYAGAQRGSFDAPADLAGTASAAAPAEASVVASAVPPSAQEPPPVQSAANAEAASTLAQGGAAADGRRGASRAAGRPSAAQASTAADATADLAEEHRLLRGARLALEQEPRRALALTAEHKQRFPSGVLAQEREVIAIEALARLGRQDAARARADRFTADFPDSPHRERVGEASAGQAGARP